MKLKGNKLLHLLFLVIMLIIIGCSNSIEISIDEHYKGWIYIIEAKKIKEKKVTVSPNRFGIVYLNKEVFNSGSPLTLSINGKDVTNEYKNVGLYEGRYYGSSSAIKIKYFKFYFPELPTEMEDDINNVVSTGNSLVDEIDMLINTGKIDTSLVW